MTTRLRYCLLLALLLLPASVAPAGEPSVLKDIGWPREKEWGGHVLTVYQPQVESWKDYRTIESRMALSIRPKEGKDAAFGTARLRGHTDADLEERSVLLSDVQIVDLAFPTLKDEQTARIRNVCEEALGGKDWILSLDRVLACLEQTAKTQPEAKVNLAPPPIFYSEKPAILVQFIGKPSFQQVAGTDLLFAVNTNWDVFLDTATGRTYLLHGESWLVTEDATKGPWAPAASLPPSLTKLPAGEDWDDVRKAIPGKPSPAAPTVLVGTQPSELILVDGPPRYVPIPGTRLLSVENSASRLFLNTGDSQHYFLVAGRWFRAKNLAGPWGPATADLPAEFLKIPEDHEAADVLASVPGSPEAQEAVIQASIPRTATVKRSEVKVVVVYDGEPRFEAIEGSKGVAYAVNTPDTVLRVKESYYCCKDGIWFVAPAAPGPWVVAATVPAEIYSIPAAHPTHNVTYVYIYDSSPDVVVVGYTSGYTGAYVAAGVLLFGVGLWIGSEIHDDWHHHHCWHYHSHYWGYGCHAHYDIHHGRYMRSGHVYGPYGGAGRGAVYNPGTGAWGRGAYVYGPRGGMAARESYNPGTGVYRASARGSSPYGSWGESVVARGDNWVHTGYRSDENGRTRAWETSEGGKGARRVGDHGSFTVAKNQEGDVYVGHDGNVYKRDGDGGWQNRKGDTWEASERSAAGRGTPPEVERDLDRQSRARRRGDSRTRRFQEADGGSSRKKR